MEARPEINPDRLSLLLGGAAVGFTLCRVIQLPVRQVELMVLGSPLGVTLSTTWWMTLFVVGLVVAGVQAIYAGHPTTGGRLGRSVVYWILPALTALAIAVLLDRVEFIAWWLLLMAAGVLLLGVVITNEYASLDRGQHQRPAVPLISTSVAYGLVFCLLTLVYLSRQRALLALPSTWILGTLLALRLFWFTGESPGRILLYAGVVGLGLSQAIWALNYWGLEWLRSGLARLLVFYLLAGIGQQALQNRIDRRVLLEYGAITLIACAAVFLLAG